MAQSSKRPDARPERGSDPRSGRGPDPRSGRGPARRYRRRTGQRLALGSIAAAGMGMAGCEQPPRDVAFNSVTECAQAGFSRQVCEAEFARALQRSADTGPRFNTEAECENDYSRCERVEREVAGQQRSFFVPFLTGYIMSSALRNLTYGGYSNYLRTNPGYSSGPIYRDYRGRDVRPVREGNRTVTRPLNRNTRTVARRGFGGRGFGRGFGG